MARTQRTPVLLASLLASLCPLLFAGESFGQNWTHWRGPEQNGVSRDKNLPDTFSVLWKVPYGGRSTPMIMNGRVFTTGAAGEVPGVPTQAEKHRVGERVMAFDKETGKLLWEKRYNVFHTDIVTNRLGWSPLAGDAENDRVYVHTTGGFLICFDGKTGDPIWQHSLTEEYGRVTGYGGRIGGGPVFDSGLVIVGLAQGSWGNFARGANRFVAFDGATGKVVWWAEAPGQRVATYYSNPVIAVINGQRLLITGGADGGVHAFQVRTGKRVWSEPISANVVNGSPVVNGNYVYITHGEENPGGGGLGRVMCLDASQVKNGRPKVVWDFRKGIRFGLASPAFFEGKLYVPDDAAKLYCFDGKTGKVLWKYNYGTVARGSPVIGDGKLYITETNYKFNILFLNGNKEPDESMTDVTHFRARPGAAGFVEVNSTPSVSDGKIYFATRDDLYCLGKKDAKPEHGTIPKMPAEKPAGDDETPAQLLLHPADVELAPGGTTKFEVRAYNANGQLLKDAKVAVKWSLPQPPLPKGAKTAPPPLRGEVTDGTLTVATNIPGQQGYVEASDGKLTARARVRVVPQVPYQQDFEKVPVGATPGGWVNTQGKFAVAELNGAKVLAKVNTSARPPLARANAFILGPDATGYTIAADVMGQEARGKMPDIGLVAQHYTLMLDGKSTSDDPKRKLRLGTWEALPRFNEPVDFDWQPGKWYRMKLTVDVQKDKAIVRGKVWERGQPEPDKWMIQIEDPFPNRTGAAALYGYVPNTDASPETPGTPIYYDNVSIMPNNKK